jgi:hypothetical protein
VKRRRKKMEENEETKEKGSRARVKLLTQNIKLVL